MTQKKKKKKPENAMIQKGRVSTSNLAQPKFPAETTSIAHSAQTLNLAVLILYAAWSSTFAVMS